MTIDLAPVELQLGEPALLRDAAFVGGVWTAGAVDWGRRDAQGQRDYRFSTSGVSAGVDMAMSDRWVAGVGLGYGDGWGGVKIPDEWRVDESNGAPTDGQNQEMLDERKR